MVPGVVEDGRLWVHGGAVYECVRGARVMVRQGYANGRPSSSMLRGCLRRPDGSRAIGVLHSRVRMGEWLVRFPGEGPLVRLPVGLHGQYALQAKKKSILYMVFLCSKYTSGTPTPRSP